ncbi:uncharacterized protein LOC108915268 [Anoplophora glabripennis]|uniref:uncharacterized protein LOC108915268 n=1 Tax=Anoplophora glabripennis TaxID=217634 RepID=UPI0008748BCC|nr:uncharacterized protein LOC108915268 [Anoplophora glabripennis]
MVTRSLCLFLLVGSLIQVNDATSSVMVIAQYIPKFLSLSVEITKVVGNGTQEIFNTQKHIKEVVDSAENKVKKQLADLDKFIAEAENKASKNHTNITSCLIEEHQGINRIHLTIMEKCRLQNSVKHLYAFSLNLAKEELSLSIVIQWCIIKHPLDGTKLKTCFDDKIDDVESKITTFQNEIRTTLPEAMGYSDSCTARYSEGLNKATDTIYWTFKNCIEAVIS